MFKVEANLKDIATRQLSQRRARKAGEPRRPVTTVNCKALHGLQFRAKVEGHSFISDEGDEAGGHDAGPAPLRYFLAGIMMCHQVWCVKSAAVADVQLDRLEGEIAGFVEPGGGDAEREVERGFDLIKYKVTVESPNLPDHSPLSGVRHGGPRHADRSHDPTQRENCRRANLRKGPRVTFGKTN